MGNIRYLSLSDAIETHRLTVEKSGGGSCEKLDVSRLKSALEMIKNDEYYPTFEDKITHLCYSACNCHCFVDGNKRIALTLSMQFLMLNGYMYCCKNFLRDMEDVILNLAQNKISKELLRDIFTAIIEDDFRNEALQLRILESISSDRK